MFTKDNISIVWILTILCIILLLFLKYLTDKKNRKQLEKAFSVLFVVHILWMVGLILQVICVDKFKMNPIYFDYFIYIWICLSPVVFLFISLIFSRTKITITKKYGLLFVIPMLSLLVLWTNDYHHLFYEKYSTDYAGTVYGKYLYVHLIYTYGLYAISLFILLKYSTKNSGFFSRQSMLILLGALAPIITNVLVSFAIIPGNIYLTPMTFVCTIICLSFAMFKFDLLKVTPIALQRIVDRISDSYIVVNEEYIITDFNHTLVETFIIKNLSNVRGKSLKNFLIDNDMQESKFKECIKKVKNNNSTKSFEIYVKRLDKHFNIEISSINSNNQFLGTLVLFKDITQHVHDMQKIKDTQESLMESERLSSLGQLIGGIAHNLRTPIMSISGATEGLRELTQEYDESIDNSQVTSQDHHEIAHDMNEWIEKIKSYTEYMSDIITAVRGQAVTLSATENISFDVDHLFKRVNILMNHELKSAQIEMIVETNGLGNTIIKGDINSLVQVINNMISNSIQSYNGKIGAKIYLIVNKIEEDLIISVKDEGCGLPDNVRDKLFKEMITTKGKNGTGLGMYMSYSTIKANFNGNITFESEKGKGTTFSISLPIGE